MKEEILEYGTRHAYISVTYVLECQKYLEAYNS